MPTFLRVPAPMMEERELENGRGYRSGKTLQEAMREVWEMGRKRDREEAGEIMLRGGSDGSGA